MASGALPLAISILWVKKNDPRISRIWKDNPPLNRFRYLLAGAGLMAAILIAYWVGSQFTGARAIQTNPADGAQTGAWGPIGVTFDRPMQASSVSARFRLEPDAPGTWRWDGQTAWFIPKTALEPGTTYTARLGAGVTSAQGDATRRETVWRFQVRPAEVVYLSPVRGAREVWRSGAGGASPRALTATGGRVIDYAVSKDGEQIVYSARNDGGGADLWLMNRDGKNARLAAGCGEDTCRMPAWSPDGGFVAYSRERAGDRKSRIWTLELRTGIAGQLYQSDQAQGIDPSFAPDGERLAFYDPAIDSLRVRSLVDGSEVIIRTAQEGGATWSADGKQMFYLDEQAATLIPRNVVVRFDFTGRKAEVLLGKQADPSDYGPAEVTADGKELVVGYELAGGTPSQQLWLFRADGTPVQAITDDPMISNGAYHWDPAGAQLVFQRSRLSSEAAPEVWVWERSSEKLTLIAENAGQPAWLP